MGQKIKHAEVISENGDKLFFDEDSNLINVVAKQETLPTKWFTTKQISTWIGEPLSTGGKKIEELEGGHGILIVSHQCGEDKLALIGQLKTMIYGLEEGFENFAN